MSVGYEVGDEIGGVEMTRREDRSPALYGCEVTIFAANYTRVMDSDTRPSPLSCLSRSQELIRP